jgi:hypothetical protein
MPATKRTRELSRKRHDFSMNDMARNTVEEGPKEPPLLHVPRIDLDSVKLAEKDGVKPNAPGEVTT